MPIVVVLLVPASAAAYVECGDPPGPAENVTASGGSPGRSCDPNYAGACLEPDAYDYDCSGGDGDGPLYTGQARVVGDDHHELDRDGDGIACDV